MTHREEIELAKQYGAASLRDTRRGGPWCKFTLGQWTLWICAHEGRAKWATAEVVNGHYTSHAYHKTLREALEHVSQQLG